MSQLTPDNLAVLPRPLVMGRSLFSKVISDLLQLAKLRITLMVVITAWIGLELGRRSLGLWEPQWILTLMTLLGTALSCMGAGALNQVMEVDTDARMHRTRMRPIASGRMSLSMGTLVGLVWSVLGVGILWLGTHPLAAIVSAFTVISYVLVYTPMKRVSSLSTVIGAVPGALPPVIGYTAVAGRFGIEAWVVFAMMFLWQLPHFLAIAWLYREDYARAGFPMLPVLDGTGRSTFRQMLLGCVALLPVGLMPTMLDFSGKFYFFGALLCGLAFLGFAVALVIRPGPMQARSVFFASLVYLPAVLALLVMDGGS